MHARSKSTTAAFALAFVIVIAPAVAQNGNHPASAADSVRGDAQEEPDVKAAEASVDSAWSMLTTATQKSTQTRIIAVAALGTMGANAHAADLIAERMKDPQLDVRTAAILAAGQTRNRSLIPALRERLKDPEPQVVFIAAATLWKMNDRSGQYVLTAVAGGERKATPTLMHGARNDVDRELHNPSALATLGATEGASMLLGPFGFGVAAFNYMRKSGSDPARAVAIDLLAQNKTPAVQRELMDALHDKDAAVRAAAAKALGQRHDAPFKNALGELFEDPKLPVRLTAAAAYINCSTRARRPPTRLQ